MEAVPQLFYVYVDVILWHLQGGQGGLPFCRIPPTFVVGDRVLLLKITERAVRVLRRRPVAGCNTRQP